MAFPRPLLFGGPVGSRRGPTPLKENGGECSVCGLVPRTGYLLARDVTTRESARARILPPAGSERGHVLDEATGKSSGNPRISSVIVTEKYYIGTQLEALDLPVIPRNFFSRRISIAIDGSCPVSPSTVEIVDNCPDSEERWRQAAARKNCTAHASSCSEPDRLVYHCLINSFVNQTLEVCAYGRIIVLGYCTEYSLGGNIVQQSFRATCTQFTEDPCPLGYPSTDAYKYPSCYGLTKKTTATSTLSTTNATYMNNEKKADGGSSKDFLLPVILVVIVALIFAVIGMYLTWKKEKFSFCRKKDHRNIYEEESKSLRVPVDTETEDVHIAPSGQFIGNGIKTKEIKIVDEEILPEHYLKPEEDLFEDCQILINSISDGLTGLAIILSEKGNEDNQLDLANLHNGYDNPDFSFSQESRQTYEDDLAEVKSTIEYFNTRRNKQGVCKE